MKISLNWLRDYIDFDLQIEQLTDLLTAIGLEVEGVEDFSSVKGGLKNLVIGEVISCEKHENADRLQVCEVNIGNDKHLQIVCGAPNVAAGQKVVVAPVGTTIFPLESEPFEIKEVKIRGVESFGMICAEDEIGLGKNHDGIIVLNENASVGELASDHFHVETDTVIEIGLTPNRSDANSHLGTARDLAAALAIQYKQKQEVNWPYVNQFSIEKNSHPITVEVKDAQACPRYAGMVISNITIKPSPLWLQNKLKAVGVKPINNIVDITNFINHEYGQPLHAFDYDKISGNKIIVQTLKQGSTFTTLDEVERKLSDEDLMICDENGGMCIAGVYGGLNSGVTDQTNTIFLESAYFDASTIRRTELRHNLRTDAAAKFEKGVDPTKQVEVLKRAALLIKNMAGGTLSSELIDIQAKEIKPNQIQLNLQGLNSLTGVDFEPTIVKQILNLLDFKLLKETEEDLLLEAPLYRADVSREADVIEEVLRIYGFNNVPLKGSTNFSLIYATNDFEEFQNEIANQLMGKDLQEIMTNSISQSKYYDEVNITKTNQLVRPINSLNTKLDVMRPDMLMTGLEAIAYNSNRNLPDCQFFDFGKTYTKLDNGYSEQNHLAIYLTGQKEPTSWLKANNKVSFYDCKQLVETILLKAKLKDWQEKETDLNYLQEGLVYMVNNKAIVQFGIVDISCTNLFNIEADVLFADINFDYLFELSSGENKQFQPISKFPTIERDLALVIDSNVNYKQVSDIAHKQGGQFLKALNLFDVFENEEKLGKNKKSYAINFTFENTKQTLTNKQIDKQMDKLIKHYKQQLSAEIRS